MKFYKYILFLIATTLLLSSCKKTDWRENYRERSKAPFGTYIIYNEAKELFNDKEVTYLKKNIYDYLTDIYYDSEENYANYICIKTNANKLNDDGIDYLLSMVSAGNDAFISLNYFTDELEEALGFKTQDLDIDKYSLSDLKALKGTLYLKNKAFKDTIFKFDRNIRRNYFSKFNEKTTIVLGTQQVDSLQLPNFIKVYHGKGAVYLHTQPITFTNYYLLNKKENYTENVLSYLPDREILWDPQVRSSKYSNTKDNTSVFKFFLKHPSLKWALYLAFGGLLLFLLFNARRKQRAIPELKKLENSTADFTHTIANLYLKEDDHKNLVDKKIAYFLERVRTKYILNTSNLNSDFIEKLALKSGNTLQTTKYLINTIIALNKRTLCSQEELMRLNTLIENFFENK